MNNQQNIFIIGYPRSGTSLLRVILDSHPDLSIGPEVKFVKSTINKYPQTFEEYLEVTEKTAGDYKYSLDELENIYNKSNSWDSLLFNWCSYFASKRNRKNWGEKTPRSYRYLKHLVVEFPEAIYIYVVRNPFDVMGSMKKKGWYKGIKSVLGWTLSNFNTRYLKDKEAIYLRYEDFVKTPENFISQILDRANLPKHELLKRYQDVDHGRIANGDIWNKPLLSHQETEKRIFLSKKDRLYIYVLGFFYLRKHNYRF